MRHGNKYTKLGRSTAHRKALMASLVCHLIEQGQIKTTVTKAKVASRLADRMITLSRRGTLAARRQAIAALRQETPVAKLFDELGARFEGRDGGYTRVVRVGSRVGDGAEMAILSWVTGAPGAASTPVEPETVEATA